MYLGIFCTFMVAEAIMLISHFTILLFISPVKKTVDYEGNAALQITYLCQTLQPKFCMISQITHLNVNALLSKATKCVAFL